MNVYSVGVRIAVSGNANQFMSTFISALTGAHVKVSKLNSTLKALAVTAAAGVGGAKMLQGVGAIITKGNEIVKVQQRMAQAGVSAAESQDAVNKAWELTAKHKNVTAASMMTLINDARMTFGDQATATRSIGPAAAGLSFLKAFQGGKHGGSDDANNSEMVAAIKSAETANYMEPGQINKHIGQLIAMKVAYGEQLTIAQYLTAQRAAGVGMKNMSEEFRYGFFPALVQEQGPNAGVSLMTSFNKVLSGQNRMSAFTAMDQLGILDSSKVKYGKGGKVKEAGIGAIKNDRDFAESPHKWIMETLKPALEKYAPGDNIKQMQMMSKIFPDRNAAKFMNEIMSAHDMMVKNARQQAEAEAQYGKTGENGQFNDKSLDGQIQGFTTQWNNLMTALGAPSVLAATEGLRRINEVVSSMSQSMAANPEAAKTMVEGMIAVGGILTGGAIVGLMAIIGPVGWLTLGLSALAAGMAYLDPGSFEAFKNFFADLPKLFSAERWNTVFTQIGTEMAAAINAIPGMVSGAISSAFAAIGNMISSAIKSLTNTDGIKAAPGDPVSNGEFRSKRYKGPTTGAAGQQGSVAPVYLDGRKVGSVVAQNIADRAGRSTGSGAGFDATQHAMPYDYNPVG